MTYFDKPVVCSPAVYHTPLNTFPNLSSLPPSEDFIETASCSTAAVLRILCKCNGSFNAISLHFSCGLFRERPDVSESYVCFVRSCFRVKLVQEFGHAFPLKLRVPQDGRTSTDFGILFFNRRRPAAGNDRCKKSLKWQWNKVPVREEVF